MTRFEDTQWKNPDYSREYRENADNFMPERRRLLRIMASFYRRFIKNGRGKRALDLGCGDGILAETLFQEDQNIALVLTDGSEEMLESAKRRLAAVPRVEFCRVTFEDVISGVFHPQPFDFLVSSFAIHHLELADKVRLFRSLPGLLAAGGCFLNIDVVTSDPYTDWYYRLWREWIVDHETETGSEVSLKEIPDTARANPDNHYDPLPAQLAALQKAGFVDVACHYKYGLFAIYGGRKPGGVG